MSNTPQTFRTGDRAWRIGRGADPLRCVISRPVAGGDIRVRATALSANETRVAAGDVFRDYASCQTEIRRRRAARREGA